MSRPMIERERGQLSAMRLEASARAGERRTSASRATRRSGARRPRRPPYRLRQPTGRNGNRSSRPGASRPQRPGKKMPISRAADSGQSRAVDQVLGDEDAEVAADGAGRGVAGVGGAHHRAHDLARCPRGPSTTSDHGRAAGDERDEVAVEAACRRARRSARPAVLGVDRCAARRRRCVRPLRSKRPTISPTRPRSTASGLQMTKVRSMGGRLGGTLRRHEIGACTTLVGQRRQASARGAARAAPTT